VSSDFSKYRIVRQLGAGGMGEVFLAEDIELDRKVALKIMSAELAKDNRQRKRFRTEARAASALIHPNICVIHDVGETPEGRPFLAMEFVEGQTLDLLSQQRHLSLGEILKIGTQTAEALTAAHSRGVVHRDIKPSNIIVDEAGRAKVLDFGLAKKLGREQLEEIVTEAAITKTGFLIGTPHYMSPEQVLGREVNQRSDIFSLGVVLYELIAGQRPFLGRTVGEVINNVVNQLPHPIGLESPICESLNSVILKCLEKDPGNRYATATELRTELARLQHQSTASALDGMNQVPCPPARSEPVAAASMVSGIAPLQQKRSHIFGGRKVINAAALVGILALIGVALHLHNRLVKPSSSAGNLASGKDVTGHNVSDHSQAGGGSNLPASKAADAEAHKLYLQARLAWNKRTEAGLRKAVQLFQQAIERDPTYAEAYGGLSATYLLLPLYAETGMFREYRPLIKAAANRSLELDPSGAEPHAVLANLFELDQDFKAAESHYKKAVELDPNYATAHHWYGRFLCNNGRRDAGLAELRKALDLDPLSPIIHSTIPEWYYMGRKFDQAIVESRKVIDAFPDFPSARLPLVGSLLLLNRFEECLAEIDAVRQLEPDHSLKLLDTRAFCLARMGREREAREIMERFEQLKKDGKQVNGYLSTIYQGFREYDKALALAEEQRLAGNWEPYSLQDPVFDEVRALPQFQAFAARAGVTNAVVF
jgi:serine/threonine protein kinase/Tfp pilus assembly protein PilF